MRQIKKILIMIFAVVLMFACHTSVSSGEITSVSITPNNPLDTDSITFNISGVAGCWPGYVVHDAFSQNGTALQLDLYISDGFLQVLTKWDYSKQIEPLSPAQYTLEVRAFGDYTGFLQDIYNTSFNVTPEPSTLGIFSMGLPFLRMFSGRKH